MKKRFIISISIILGLALLLVPSSYFLKQVKDLNRFKGTITKLANERINGRIEFGDLKWSLQKGRLGFRTAFIRLKDANENIIFLSDDSLVLFKWDTLVRGFGRFKQIKAGNITVNLVRDKEGIWNFTKLVKKRRKSNLTIDKLDIEHTKLHIEDQEIASHIGYEDMLIRWEIKRFKRNYLVDIRSHQDANKVDDDEIANEDNQNEELNESKPKEAIMVSSDRSHLNNYFRINGLVPLFDPDTWANSKTKFDFDVINFKLDDFKAILNSFEKIKNISGLVNAKGTIKRKTARELDALGHLDLKDFSVDLVNSTIAPVNFKKVDFNYNLIISDKQVEFKDFLMKMDEMETSLKGFVTNWKKQKPKLNLRFSTNEFKFRKALNLIPKSVIPKHILLRLDAVYDSLVKLDLELKDEISKPRASGKLDLKGLSLLSYDRRSLVAKDIDLSLTLKNNKVNFENFEFPLGLSKVKVNGNFDILKDAYDFKLLTKDLSLSILRKVLLDSYMANQYRAHLSKFDIAGLASIDIHLVKELGSELSVYGSSRFGKVNFLSSNPRILLRNAYGDIKFDDRNIKVNVFKGFFEDNYFETLGTIALLEQPMVDLKFASNKLDLKEIIDSKILDFIGVNFNPLFASGNLKNLRLDLKGLVGTSDLKYSGSVLLDNLTFKKYDSSPLVSEANGLIKFSDDNFEFEDIKFMYNLAPVNIAGSVDRSDDDMSVDLNILASQFRLKDFYFFLDEYTNLSNSETFKSIHDIDGSIDVNAKINDNGVQGELNLFGATFFYPRLPLQFNNLLGKVIFDGKDFLFENLNGNFGKSDFTLSGKVNDYMKNPHWDLDLKSNMLMEELSPHLSTTYNKYLKIDGILPVESLIQGNKTKTFLDVKVEGTNLKGFSFSNWLVYDKKANLKVRSKLTITPQTIFSDSSKITFKTGESKSRVDVLYQVKDWTKPELSFYLNFETKDDNTDAQLLLPNIYILKPFKIRASTGNFKCETYGNRAESQTICGINVASATAAKYGIGDLNANNIHLDLLGITQEPVKTNISASNGDWNTIPFKNLDLDLLTTVDTAWINDLNADVREGKVWADVEYGLFDFISKFTIEGNNVPANDIARGVWAIGQEVPSGLIAGKIKGTTKGIELEDMFNNLVADAHFVVKDGKLSTLKTMQKYLSALSSFGGGFFGLDLNSVMQTLVTYKGGTFDNLIGSLHYDNAKVNFEKVLLKAEQIELEVDGAIDYTADSLNIVGRGLIPKSPKSLLQKVGVGKLNLGNVLGGAKDKEKNKRFFEFKMNGKVSDEKEAVNSLRENFTWL